MSKRMGWLSVASLLTAGLSLTLLRAEPASAGKANNKSKEVWTDPADSTLPADFQFQGEYVTSGKESGYGVQVIALGKGTFQAVVYPGGLPGAGWDGKNKSLMDGKLEGDTVTFAAVKGGKRRYKDGGLGTFSATEKFPPTGHKEMTGSLVGKTLTVKADDGSPKTLTLTRTVRKSPTRGAKPPEGAIVLFDGKSADAFTGGRLDAKTGLLNTDGHDIRTKGKFNNYKVHLEFFLPYRPDARDQGRGNSGFYQVDMYEVQILDSFGLEGKNNECGGVYQRLDSKVNMCLPPLQWQTYDVEFTNAVQGPTGKKKKNARITARLNGVVIHDDAEIEGKTGGARGDAEGTPGPLQLQGHGNPLQFRNMWLIEKVK